MTIEPTSKKSRIDENQNSTKKNKHFFNRLPLSLEDLIYSFINVSTVHSLILTNTSFKRIVSNFFMYSPSTFESFISFSQGHISYLPSYWQAAYEKGFPHLSTLLVSGYRKNEKLIENISKASNLQSLFFLGFYTQSAFQSAASLPNLTELDIAARAFEKDNILESCDSIWNCVSLKKLSITGNITKLNPPKTNQPILPNLKSLTLQISVDDPSSVNELVGRMTSISDLAIKGSFVLQNETLLKLTNLKSLFFAYPDINIVKLSNLHSLEFVTTIFDFPYLYHTPSEVEARVSALNAIALVIKNLPNLKKFTINYTSHFSNYNYSKIDELNNVHFKMNMDYFSRYEFIEFDKLSSVKSFSLKVDFHFLSFRRKSIYNQFLYPDPPDYRTKLPKLLALPGLKEIDIILKNSVSENEVVEEIFISFLNQLSHLISSIEAFHDFLWSDKVLKQLQTNKLINCSKVKSHFLKTNNKPFSNDEIFQLFPKLTWENLIRINTKQFAVAKTKEV